MTTQMNRCVVLGQQGTVLAMYWAISGVAMYFQYIEMCCKVKSTTVCGGSWWWSWWFAAIAPRSELSPRELRRKQQWIWTCTRLNWVHQRCPETKLYINRWHRINAQRQSWRITVNAKQNEPTPLPRSLCPILVNFLKGEWLVTHPSIQEKRRSGSRLGRNSNYFWHGPAMTRHTHHSLSLVTAYSMVFMLEERVGHCSICRDHTLEFVDGLCMHVERPLFMEHSHLVLPHTSCPELACMCLSLPMCFVCLCVCNVHVRMRACVCVC